MPSHLQAENDEARRDDVLRRKLTTPRKPRESIRPELDAAEAQLATDQAILKQTARGIDKTRDVIERSKEAIKASEGRLRKKSRPDEVLGRMLKR